MGCIYSLYLCFVKHWIVFLHYTMDLHYFGKNKVWHNTIDSSRYTLHAARCSMFRVRCLDFSHCHSLLPDERSSPFYFIADGYNYGLSNSYTVEGRTFLMFSIIHIKLQRVLLFSNTCPNRHITEKGKDYPYCGHMSKWDLAFRYGCHSLDF